MSGFGERFRRAGYNIPKPLIEVDGKPIITHVVNMFSDDDEFLFICNKEHLKNSQYNMRKIISNCCKKFTILGIEPHKLGPVYAVLQAEHTIKDEPLLINYCDFSCYWDWGEFKRSIENSEVAGSIPAYKGFHPHSLGKTNYAYIRESDLTLKDIQEKEPFTNNKMLEYASSGTYYFSSGKEMLNAFKYLINNNYSVNNEYYVSLAYKYYLNNNQKISIYPIQHFMQWGTPEDLEEYQTWSDTFKDLIKNSDSDVNSYMGSKIIPMAGLGKRFVDKGYKTIKPLIPISGKPMVIQANNDLPKSHCTVFVMRENIKGYEIIRDKINKNDINAMISSVKGLTSGQAITALEGLNYLEKNYDGIIEPVTIGACDNGCLYHMESFDKLINKEEVDIIVWGKRNHLHAKRNPKMYGWIDVMQSGEIKGVKVKEPISNKLDEPIIIGTFSFKHANYLRDTVNNLISKNQKINGEFYLDSCINEAIKMGLKCYLFEVDRFLSWGTPNDFNTFEYWQSCFHKWDYHPYSLEKDIRVEKDNIHSLINKFNHFE